VASAEGPQCFEEVEVGRGCESPAHTLTPADSVGSAGRSTGRAGARLDALARGLAKELAAVQGETLTVLLYRECHGYLEAARQALGGAEDGRVTLARALRRLER
jgi:hypothetical protein